LVSVRDHAAVLDSRDEEVAMAVVPPPTATALLGVYGMRGASGERRVRRALESIPGVASVGVSRAYRQAVVAYDASQMAPAALAEAVVAAGFGAIAIGLQPA
jgi:P-type Cu+ transporter